MKKMKLKELKLELEQRYPRLTLGYGTFENVLIVVDNQTYREVAKSYHKKFVVHQSIKHLGDDAFDVIELLSKWDGVK